MRKNLFLTLIVLGVVIAGASVLFAFTNSARLAGISAVDVEVVGRAIARGEDRVAPADLADWLIQDRKDVLAVDLRPPERFAAQHIQGARNIPITDLLKGETLERLPPDRLIVLYAEDTEQAAQAAALLRLAGYQARFLAGGLAGWGEQVLRPVLGGDVSDAEQRKRRAVARHFGGEAAVQVSARAERTAEAAPAATEATAPAPQTPAFAPAVAPAVPPPDETPSQTPSQTGPGEGEGKLIVDEGC